MLTCPLCRSTEQGCAAILIYIYIYKKGLCSYTGLLKNLLHENCSNLHAEEFQWNSARTFVAGRQVSVIQTRIVWTAWWLLCFSFRRGSLTKTNPLLTLRSLDKSNSNTRRSIFVFLGNTRRSIKARRRRNRMASTGDPGDVTGDTSLHPLKPRSVISVPGCSWPELFQSCLNYWRKLGWESFLTPTERGLSRLIEPPCTTTDGTGRKTSRAGKLARTCALKSQKRRRLTFKNK